MISLRCGIRKTKQMDKENKTERGTQIHETNCWLPEEGEGLGAAKIGEGDQKVQTYHYKLSKSWGEKLSIGNIVNNTVMTQYSDRW